MKAITIQEPWASLILSGKKTIETRTWQTQFRGKILLTASLKPKTKLSGKAFAVANLVDIVPMTKAHEHGAQCRVYPGAFAWILKEVTPIEQFEVKGRLGLFEVKVK